jgi:transcriptional antiterminator RfaH
MSATTQQVVPPRPPTHNILLDSHLGNCGMHNNASGPLAANALGCGRYSAPRWCIITTGPRAEDLAHQSLLALGFDAFLPRVNVPLKQHTVSRPLFPGYLFAAIDTSLPDWGDIYRARGVDNVLKGPGATLPDTIPLSAIEAIRAHCDRVNTVVADIRYSLISAGVQVAITDGVFIDQRGVCLWSSHQRVRLMLDVLGTVVNLPRQAVVEVG